MAAARTQSASAADDKVEVEFLEDSFGIKRGQVKKVDAAVAAELIKNRHAQRATPKDK